MDYKKYAEIATVAGAALGWMGIIPLVVGYFSLQKQKEGNVDILWKILTLVFVNPVAGVLLLLDKE